MMTAMFSLASFGSHGDDRGILHQHDRTVQRVPSPAVDERDAGDRNPHAHVSPSAR
jgi:hypothetical protein